MQRTAVTGDELIFSVVGWHALTLPQDPTSNLLSILAACADEDVNDVARRYATKHHGDLKADVPGQSRDSLVLVVKFSVLHMTGQTISSWSGLYRQRRAVGDQPTRRPPGLYLHWRCWSTSAFSCCSLLWPRNLLPATLDCK